jgi:hypothetical protein
MKAFLTKTGFSSFLKTRTNLIVPNQILMKNTYFFYSTKSIYGPLTKKKDINIEKTQPKTKIKKKRFKNKSMSDAMEKQEEKEFQEYVENFLPFESLMRRREIELRDLIICQEYLIFLHLVLKKKYDKASKIIEEMKVMLRGRFIGSYIYNFILRRSGLCNIFENKIIEGILDLENVYEFSKNRDVFNSKYRFNAKIELLKTYMKYDPLKCKHFAKLIYNDEYEIKILDLDQLGILYHLVGVSTKLN